MTAKTKSEEILAAPPRFCSFNNAKEGDTTFLAERDPTIAVHRLALSHASRVFIHEDIANRVIRYHNLKRPEVLIASKNPKLEFIRELAEHTPEDEPNQIEAGVRIGENCTINNSRIGKDVIIYANTSIGQPALSVERDEQTLELVRFPHIGRVLIEDKVTIMSECHISRGTLDDTVIGANTIIDDQVHIAHNCQIGVRNQITAGAVFGGSVTSGTDCWIGLGAVINDHVTLGNNVLVGSGAVVTRDVPDKDIVAGVPAKSIKAKCTLSQEKRFHYVGY